MASATYNTTMHGGGFPSQYMPPTMEVSAFSAVQIATLQAKLDQNLGPEYISTRPGPGGGSKLTYAEGWKIINLANEVFGFNGWLSSITNLTVDFIDTHGENPPRYNVGVHCITRVTLRDGAYHEDVGYGFMDNAKQKGAALDKCKKEAVTDALKRTLRNFGNVLGNCLYDKSYTEQVNKIKLPPAKKLDPNDLHRRPEFDPKLSAAPASTSMSTATTAVSSEPPPVTTAAAPRPAAASTSTPNKVIAPPPRPAPPAHKMQPPQTRLVAAPAARLMKQEVSAPEAPPSPDMFGSEDDSFLAQVDLDQAAYNPAPPQLAQPILRKSLGSSSGDPQMRQNTTAPLLSHAQKAGQSVSGNRVSFDISANSISTHKRGPQQPQANGGQTMRPPIPQQGSQANRMQAQGRPAVPPPQQDRPQQQQQQHQSKQQHCPMASSHANGPLQRQDTHKLSPTHAFQPPQAPQQQTSAASRIDRGKTSLGGQQQGRAPRPPDDPIRSGSIGGFHFPPGANGPPSAAARLDRQPPQPQGNPRPPEGFVQAGIKRSVDAMSAQGNIAQQSTGSDPSRWVLGDLELDERGNPKRPRR